MDADTAAAGPAEAMSHLLSAAISGPAGKTTVAAAASLAWEERYGRDGAYAAALGEVGMRVAEEEGRPVLMLNPSSPALERIFAGTRWSGRRAHLVLRGVAGVSRKLTPNAVRIGGRLVRAQAVPLNLVAGVEP